MESRDLELIERFETEDSELSALWEQHQSYGKLIEKMEAKAYLSDTEVQEVKELKKKKLAGKTKLQEILDKYRESEN